MGQALVRLDSESFRLGLQRARTPGQPTTALREPLLLLSCHSMVRPLSFLHLRRRRPR